MRLYKEGNFTSFVPESWAEDVALTIVELSVRDNRRLSDEIGRALKKGEPDLSDLEAWASRLNAGALSTLLSYDWIIDDAKKGYFEEADGVLKFVFAPRDAGHDSELGGRQ